MNRPLLSLAFSITLLTGCVDLSAPESESGDQPLLDGPHLQHCRGHAFTAPTPGGWRHWGSGLVALGGPTHSARDLLVSSGHAISLGGTFTYGGLNLAISDETVTAYLDDCNGWHAVGTALTDSAGRAAVALSNGLPPGSYDVRLVVEGDASAAPAVLWVLPSGSHIVVSDIDGTLTTSDFEQLLDLLIPDYVAKHFAGSVELTNNHLGIGHLVVYLTGRAQDQTTHTRAWLDHLGFADGPIHLSDSLLLPTDDSTGAYKRDYLAGLIAQGFVIDVAYGNATTDIFAYLQNGIPASRTWIIGPNAGQQGTTNPGADWTGRAAQVDALPQVVQPFTW